VHDFKFNVVYSATITARAAFVRGVRRVAEFLEAAAYTAEDRIDGAAFRVGRLLSDLKHDSIQRHKELVQAEQRRLNEEASFISASAVERIRRAMDEANDEHARALSLRKLAEEHGDNHEKLVDAHA
jgi:hypothetical protein